MSDVLDVMLDDIVCGMCVCERMMLCVMTCVCVRDVLDVMLDDIVCGMCVSDVLDVMLDGPPPARSRHAIQIKTSALPSK